VSGPEFWEDLSRRNITVTVADGRLKVSAPAGAITPEIRQQLAERRDELVSLLDSGDGDALPYTVADLEQFDKLIRRYCEILGHPGTKREDLLAARRRMRPASVAGELAEFRALVAELEGRP
jgi:TubC N-terminal docking domain